MLRTLISSLAATAGMAALLAAAPRGATAQIGYFGPGAPFGNTLRPLGPQGPINIGPGSTPYFTVSPRGITPGYLGPNGPYAVPNNRFEAGAYPYNSSVGTTASGSLYAPFTANPPAGSGDPVNPAFVAAVPVPRTSESVEARIDKDNRLFVKWSGDSAAVSQIRVALLDKDRSVLKTERITKLPAEAKLAITSRTMYYQVYVEYVNGAVTNFVSPL